MFTKVSESLTVLGTAIRSAATKQQLQKIFKQFSPQQWQDVKQELKKLEHQRESSEEVTAASVAAWAAATLLTLGVSSAALAQEKDPVDSVMAAIAKADQITLADIKPVDIEKQLKREQVQQEVDIIKKEERPAQPAPAQSKD
jgi:uncharacterized protein YgfB (UPF0149 family)